MHQVYVEWLVTGKALSVSMPEAPSMTLLKDIPIDSGAGREALAWGVVQGQCLSCCGVNTHVFTHGDVPSVTLDAYAQRCSATEARPEAVYEQLLGTGGGLVEKYLKEFLDSRKEKGVPQQQLITVSRR